MSVFANRYQSRGLSATYVRTYCNEDGEVVSFYLPLCLGVIVSREILLQARSQPYFLKAFELGHPSFFTTSSSGGP